MQRRTVRLGAGLAVALALSGIARPVRAQFVAGVHMIPVIARLHGAQQTFWKSDLSISNVGASSTTVNGFFYREKQDNGFIGFNTPMVQVAIPAGETLTVEDVLGTWFPSQGDTKGVLIITSSTEGEAALAVTSRTYNAADPKGTYGQAVPSSLLDMVFGAGRTILSGIRNDDDFRSSIGIVNLGPKAVVRITFYDASGAVVAETTKTIQSFSLEQWNVAKLGMPKLGKPGRAVIALDASTPGYDPCAAGNFSQFSSLLAYGSTVDNRTGDAVFSSGQTQWSEYVATCGGSPPGRCNPTVQGMGFMP